MECHNQTGQYAFTPTQRSSVSEALKNLYTHHLLLKYSPTNGCWINSNSLSIYNKHDSGFIAVGTRLGDPKVIDPKDLYLRSFGVGREYVYIIYSTDVRIEAIINKIEFFPLKIGKTKNIERRIEQLSESGPNTLTVGAIFCTDNSADLERYIHNELKKAGQYLEVPGRREWFRSNISTTIGIYNDFIRERRGYE